MWIGRHAPDGVAGVDIFQGDIHFDFFKIVLNLIFEKETDIAKADVAGFIALAGGSHQVLTGTFAHHHYRMFSRLQPFLQGIEKTIQVKAYFRDQAKINIAIGNGSKCCDKTGFASHQLYQTDTVSGPLGFRVC